MKRFLPFLIVAAMALITIFSGAALYRTKLRASESATNGPPGISPTHVRGATEAPVTIEEFADFQCPACATTTMLSIRPLEKDFGSRLRIVFWHFPLPNHKHGREAALAAEAAAQQGRFWEMHDLLYQNQTEWSNEENIRPVFERYAQQLQLDIEKFKQDFQSNEVAATVDQQKLAGETRGVKNTPTIFINGREFPPPFNPERLHEAVNSAVATHKNS